MYLLKVISKKLREKNVLADVLKVTDENSKIRFRIKSGQWTRIQEGKNDHKK
jgi:hypothetical protein